MALCHPTIFVPGITATTLVDHYPLGAQTVWSAAGIAAGKLPFIGAYLSQYDRIQLHPDDPRYEAREPARVQPGEVFDIAYAELIEELRHNLREREDEPVPVHQFPYDWRQPLAETERQLEAFVDEVIARARLLRHYHDEHGSAIKVNLIGHSMGGLIIGGYLERAGGAKVNKVATLCTPFRGAVDAVVKMATGESRLGGGSGSTREREAARMTPALYHLLPRFRKLDGKGFETVVADGGHSIFDREVWQQSVIDTIEEYVRIHSVSAKTRAQQKALAEKVFRRLLDDARRHRDRVEKLSLARAGLGAKSWLCVVGVDEATATGFSVKGTAGKRWFDLSEQYERNDWGAQQPAHRWETGDGTVPLRGALPPFLAPEQVVAVSHKDFSFFELKDRGANLALGLHANIANMNLVQRMLVAHLTGRRFRAGALVGRRLPGVTRWDLPIAVEPAG